MKKIVTIVGARPQFIKAAVLSRLIRQNEWSQNFKEIIIHTGQHYDSNMSDIFFEEMDIPKPDYNLNIGSGTHGRMTGEMLIKIEDVLVSAKPDIVLVYGDTNSTLAGALAAAKLNIPIAHVEAGLRSFWKVMPEEQNRILTDHLSKWLFCPTNAACENLKKEGITEGVSLTGDIMYDASMFYKKRIAGNELYSKARIADRLRISEAILNKGFFLLTIHRAENTDSKEALLSIIEAINECKMEAIFPIHPRTKKILENFGVSFGKHVHLVSPIGYLDMLALEMNSNFIVTDSGGVQKEAYFVKKPCITLRDQTEWVETVDIKWNQLVGTNKERILNAINNIQVPKQHFNFYGDGNCAHKILTLLD